MGTTRTEQTPRDTSPERLLMPAPTPPQTATLLTARPFADAHAALIARLREAGYGLRVVSSWEHVTHEAGETGVDGILVDFDAVECQCAGHRAALSGFRLVRLLHQQIAGGATSLIVFTTLDYTEIEEVAYAVHQIISPLTPTSSMVALVEGALSPRARRSASRTSEDRATEPVAVTATVRHTSAPRADEAAPFAAL